MALQMALQKGMRMGIWDVDGTVDGTVYGFVDGTVDAYVEGTVDSVMVGIADGTEDCNVEGTCAVDGLAVGITKDTAAGVVGGIVCCPAEIVALQMTLRMRFRMALPNARCHANL